MTSTSDRPVVRGRRQTLSEARLAVNETGLEAQPAQFSIGMWAVILFVSSETMFFGALFTTYFYLKARLANWEPVLEQCVADCHKPGWEGLPLVNTIILVASSFTMQFAVWSIQRGDRVWLRNWLAVTVVMGVVFLAGQGYEYSVLGFLPDNGIFAAVFFTLTGFHGAHVLGGVLFNSLVLFRAWKGHFSARRHLAVEAASIYWHFVDVVWIGLFTTIYIIS
ncbi:MAG TPA: heme-copper oxidase subunit III [Candidatus Limnocylindrales bacterium]|nr:heme-copper oxidase subunit III [Candidatus Limnocylindrales bacterium]